MFNADLYTAYYPVHWYAYRSTELLPLWNPHQFAGMPFLAGANGLLYPLNFLARWIPVGKALGYVSAAHLALAGVGTFLCARALHASVVASVTAGLAYMLNSQFLFSLIHPSHLAGYAWLPFVFLAAGRVLTRPSPTAGTLLALAMAVLLFTGSSQMVCYSAYAIVVAGIAYFVLERRVEPVYLVRLSGAVGAALVVAAVLTAVQWMPTLELLAYSARGRLSLDATLLRAPIFPTARAVIASAGPISLLAIVAMVLRFRSSAVAILAIVFAFAFLVGLETPLYTSFFYYLPGVDRFRLSNRMFLIAELALAILAGLGLDALRSRSSSVSRAILGSLLLAAVVVFFGVVPPFYRAALIGLIVLLSLLGGRLTGAVAAALVAALVLTERFVDARGRMMLPQHNSDAFFEASPPIAYLQQHAGVDRAIIAQGDRARFPLMHKAGTLFGLNLVQDYEPLLPSIYNRFIAPLGDERSDSPIFWQTSRLPTTELGWRVLDMLAVRYVVVGRDQVLAPASSERLRTAFEDGEVFILENPRSLPRAYLVEESEVIPGEEEALGRLHGPDFDPERRVVLDQGPSWRSSRAPATEVREVEITRLEPEQVDLRVRTPRRSILVLTDLHFPGWSVSVDGEPRPLLRANALFRAVAVEPGEHEVRFTFVSRSLQRGAGVTLVGLAALALAAIARPVRAAFARPRARGRL